MKQADDYLVMAESAATLTYQAELKLAFKPAEKHNAILRVLRDSDGTITSYTAAEKQVELEPGYAGYLREMLNAQRDAAYATAKARALEIAALYGANTAGLIPRRDVGEMPVCR